MLVLSRKIKEEILIGNDVRITLLRIDGNKVRIGIDAPKEVRVMRAELNEKEEVTAPQATEEGSQLSDREHAFAHPQPMIQDRRALPRHRVADAQDPQVFVGTVSRDGSEAKLKRAPLSDYVTAG